MNTPHRPTRFETVAALAHADGTLLHRSTRSAMSTNVSPEAQTTVVTTQLLVSVQRGTLRIKFGAWDSGTARRGALRLVSQRARGTP